MPEFGKLLVRALRQPRLDLDFLSQFAVENEREPFGNSGGLDSLMVMDKLKPVVVERHQTDLTPGTREAVHGTS